MRNPDAVLKFDQACRGLHAAIAHAVNPALNEYTPYLGDRHVWASAAAMAAVRRARAAGLYPSTAQLALEAGERSDELHLELECTR